MKNKFMNSMTGLLTAGICFGIGGALILGGMKVDHQREEAYKIAVQQAEERAAAVQMAAKEAAEKEIDDVYPPLSELPEEADESNENDADTDTASEDAALIAAGESKISWVSFDEGGDAESVEEADEDADEDEKDPDSGEDKPEDGDSSEAE